jgi:hypothetical protein
MFFADFHDSSDRAGYNPTLRKRREGWGTHAFVFWLGVGGGPTPLAAGQMAYGREGLFVFFGFGEQIAELIEPALP